MLAPPRQVTRRLLFALASLALCLSLNACGGGASTSPTEAKYLRELREGANQPSHNEETPTTTATTTQTPVATRNFVDSASTLQGDRLSVEGRVGPLLRPGESGTPSAQALAECPGLSGREMLIQVELAATIDSSLGGTVELGMPAPGIVNYAGSTDYLNVSNEKTECASIQNADTQRIRLGTLQPHQQSQFASLWVVVVEAITPTDPNPTPSSLAKRGLALGGVTGNINGNGAITKVAATGQASLVCGALFERRALVTIVPATCSELEKVEHGEVG